MRGANYPLSSFAPGWSLAVPTSIVQCRPSSVTWAFCLSTRGVCSCSPTSAGPSTLFGFRRLCGVFVMADLGCALCGPDVRVLRPCSLVRLRVDDGWGFGLLLRHPLPELKTDTGALLDVPGVTLSGLPCVRATGSWTSFSSGSWTSFSSGS